MKTRNFLYILTFFAAITIVSCSNDDDNIDTVPPAIQIVEPHAHEEFEAGHAIHAEIIFSDNEALASYKIDIHYAGDGHSHGFTDDFEEWDYEQEGTLQGSDYTLHANIDIPEEINGKPIQEGEYHFGVFCIDAAGNQNVVWRIIVIGEHDGHDH